MPRQTFKFECGECAEPFTCTDHRAEFCSSKCRMAWNNRRAKRGALIIDLYFHQRFNREKAQDKGVHSVMDRMISNWMAEDREANNGKGRRSMRDLCEAMETALPHAAHVTSIRAGR